MPAAHSTHSKRQQHTAVRVQTDDDSRHAITATSCRRLAGIFAPCCCLLLAAACCLLLAACCLLLPLAAAAALLCCLPRAACLLYEYTCLHSHLTASRAFRAQRDEPSASSVAPFMDKRVRYRDGRRQRLHSILFYCRRTATHPDIFGAA